ncbi:MAG: hypothetical protein J6M53_02195 [Bacteroidaceae bacterium]|nr:hypothetical protein [Bacteroidaceae bacterium]
MQKGAFFLCLAFAALPAAAQTNGSNSPYSRYGFGLPADGAQSFNKGMAGTGYALSDGEQLNFKNPATYAAIDSAAFLFDVGFTLQNANIGTSRNRTNARNARVDYAAAGFRMLPGFGLSLGFRPYSTVGYNLSGTSTFERAGIDVTQTETYNGDGGLREAYLGLGFSPFKGLSVGFNAGYLWGELNHSVKASFSDATIYTRNRKYEADISTYKVEFGLQYHKRLSPLHAASIGLVYGLGHDIDSRASYYDQQISSTTVVSADTQRVNKAFALPHTFGVGLGWNYAGKLRVGLDYTFQKWGSVKSPVLDGTTYVSRAGELKDRHLFSLGAEFMPNPRGNNWRDHIRYSLGLTYATPYSRVNGEDGPSEYGASLGVALPITTLYTYTGNYPVLHLSAGYRRVQPKHSWLVSENYLWVSVGLTFNEMWFQKWRVR